LGGQAIVKINADTNVLVRLFTLDAPAQARIARDELKKADLVAVAVPALCELVWVLARGYRLDPATIAATLRTLAAAENVELDRGCVAAGIAALEAGGDFADGAIAHEGVWLGAEEFVSFDKQAVRVLNAAGVRARLLGRQ
jgi:predicted nucleic-acid-binding protein